MPSLLLAETLRWPRYRSEHRKREPLRQGPAKRLGTTHLDCTGTESVRPRQIAAPDLDHAAQVGVHRHCHWVTRIHIAHVGVISCNHHPPIAGPDWYVGKSELDHGSSAWDSGVIDVAVHVPQQELRIEVLVAEFSDPADAPGAQRLDHRPQF